MRVKEFIILLALAERAVSAVAAADRVKRQPDQVGLKNDYDAIPYRHLQARATTTPKPDAGKILLTIFRSLNPLRIPQLLILIPGKILGALISNPDKFIKDLTNAVKTGQLPDWLKSLPNDLKELLIGDLIPSPPKTTTPPRTTVRVTSTPKRTSTYSPPRSTPRATAIVTVPQTVVQTSIIRSTLPPPPAATVIVTTPSPVTLDGQTVLAASDDATSNLNLNTLSRTFATTPSAAAASASVSASPTTGGTVSVNPRKTAILGMGVVVMGFLFGLIRL